VYTFTKIEVPLCTYLCFTVCIYEMVLFHCDEIVRLTCVIDNNAHFNC